MIIFDNLNQGLIEAARLGSIVAFEQLISPVERKMLSVAAGLSSNRDDAEDIYQEAMLSAYKAMPKFRADSQFVTWLYRIVVNTACNSRRKLKNKFNQLLVAESADFAEPTYETYGTETNPETELETQQLSEAICKAIENLSEQEKIAFVLCHQHELKLKDAAVVMGCGLGTVKSTLFRAREKMRTQLESYLR